jgi:hypothetical protein
LGLRGAVLLHVKDTSWGHNNRASLASRVCLSGDYIDRWSGQTICDLLSTSMDKQMGVWTIKLLLIAVLKVLVCSLYIVPGVSGAQGLWHSNTNSLQFMHPFRNICNNGLPLLKTSPQFSFMPMFLEYKIQDWIYQQNAMQFEEKL